MIGKQNQVEGGVRRPRTMCEEIEWLDEELTNLTAELTEEAKQITSKEFKKLSKGARADKVCLALQVWTSRARADARTPLCSACMHACAFLRPRIQTLVIPACAASCTLLPFTRNNKCFVFYAVRRHKRAFDACKRRTFLISSRASTSAQGSGKGHLC